jgi:hypothetical protein
MKQIVLLHGNDEVRIAERRLELLSTWLPREARSENFSEYYPTGNRSTVALSAIMSDVMGDLSLMPFPPAPSRVVVIHNLDELFARRESGSQGKKESRRRGKNAEQRFVDFLKSQLPATNNIVLFIAVEDYERNKKINPRSGIYRLAASAGVVEQYEEKPMAWEFNDAFIARETGRCIQAFRAWFGAVKQAQPIFFNLARQIEMLTQARLLERLERTESGEKLEYYFPREMTVNMRLESDARRRLFMERAQNFSFSELIAAMERLLKLNTFVFPTREDPYVPDIQVLLEGFIVDTLEGRRQ